MNADIAERLTRLFGRAKTEVTIPEAEVAGMMAELRAMRKADVLSLAREVNLSAPGRTKTAVIRRIEGKLNAGRRVMNQTEI